MYADVSEYTFCEARIPLVVYNDFAELVNFILVSDHALLHSYPTTDNNISTSMI